MKHYLNKILNWEINLMNKKPLIGVLENKLQPDTSFKMVQNLNVDLVIFSPRTIDWDRQMVRGLLLIDGQFKERDLPFPEAVYLRKYTASNTLAGQIENLIGDEKVFNSVTKFNKWKTYCILKDCSISFHLPDTYKYKTKKVFRLLNRLDKVIVKPKKGYLGKGIYIVEKEATGKFNLYHHFNSPEFTTKSKKALLDKLATITSGREYIIQKFIDFDRVGGHLYDLRILVQRNGSANWEITGGYSRVAGLNFYKTNYSSTLLRLDEVVKESNLLCSKQLSNIKQIALRAAKILESGYGHLGDISIDFGLGRDGTIWIIEVNGKTIKRTVTRLDDDTLIRNTYLKPIEYASYLSKNI